MLLDTCRSPFGDLGGVEFEYEKFSSMGNGFTFELETVIFYALARACGGSKACTHVFGDDIITESEVVPLLREVLDFCGFVVNEEKSFSSGSFRESCGHDYFDGVFVRPVFWQDEEFPTWFKVINDLYSLVQRYQTLDPECAKRLRKVWFWCSNHFPAELDLRVPEGYGSFGVVDPVLSAKRLRPLSRRESDAGWDGAYFRGWVFKSTPVPCWASQQALMHCLDGGAYEGTGNTSFRGIGKWKKIWVYQLGAYRKGWRTWQKTQSGWRLRTVNPDTRAALREWGRQSRSRG